MSGYTPGPWILHADTRSIEAVEPSSGLPLTTICTFPNPSFIWDSYNARLIAAAPELAEALRAVDQEWTEFWPDGPDSSNPAHDRIMQMSEITRAIWRQIRAALAKAGL